MNTQQVSETVDGWILEEDLAPRFGLKPIRKFDGLYPDDDEEWEAYHYQGRDLKKGWDILTDDLPDRQFDIDSISLRVFSAVGCFPAIL